MLPRQPDVVTPRSHNKAEALRPSAMLSCIPTCRHPPFSFQHPSINIFLYVSGCSNLVFSSMTVLCHIQLLCHTTV